MEELMVFIIISLVVWNVLLTACIIKIAKDGWYAGITIPYIKFDKTGIWFQNGHIGSLLIRWFWI